jgi:hypothetical protein
MTTTPTVNCGRIPLIAPGSGWRGCASTGTGQEKVVLEKQGVGGMRNLTGSMLSKNRKTRMIKHLKQQILVEKIANGPKDQRLE